jgi:diaminohydroxyphosphoribosylaminopyrimidine deaminase/5-amino-6-(5-phosphoribosylamino)uracil reductase
MKMALELAEMARGRTSPNPMVGAVIVRDGQILGQGYHRRSGTPHAEILAIEQAGGDVRNATLYVNLEPCSHQGKTPPCVDAIIKKEISRVVVAMIDPNPLVMGRGIKKLRLAGIEVDCGVMEGEARRLNEAFVTFHLLKRPFVIAKWAMTLDGRTSADSGDSRWISCDASRHYAHELRATSDAVAVGSGTVLLDNPRLNVRLDGFEYDQPRRIIFDGSLRIPIGARCLDNSGGEVIIVTSSAAAPERIDRLRASGHEVLVVPSKSHRIPVEDAIPMLGDHGIQSLLVEGGRQLHTSLLQAHLIDKLVVFLGPKLLGGELSTTPLCNLGIQQVRNAISLKNVSTRLFGSDVCIEGYLNILPKIEPVSI